MSKPLIEIIRYDSDITAYAEACMITADTTSRRTSLLNPGLLLVVGNIMTTSHGESLFYKMKIFRDKNDLCVLVAFYDKQILIVEGRLASIVNGQPFHCEVVIKRGYVWTLDGSFSQAVKSLTREENLKYFKSLKKGRR